MNNPKTVIYIEVFLYKVNGVHSEPPRSYLSLKELGRLRVKHRPLLSLKSAILLFFCSLKSVQAEHTTKDLP